MSRGIAALAALVCALAASVSPGLAQVPDHLKCQDVKESSGKREFTADVGGLVLEPGCMVKLPAKLLCEDATSCAGTCTSDDQCVSGQVCAGAVDASLCCHLHS